MPHRRTYHRKTTERVNTVQKTFSYPRIIVAIVLGIMAFALFLFPSIFMMWQQIQRPLIKQTIQSESDASSSANLLTGPIHIDASLLHAQNPGQRPLRILIPTLNIDIPIISAKIINGFWEVSDTTASHGEGSAFPGQNGNIVIFAHARERLFLPLRNISPNTDIYLLTTDRWYRYRTTKTQVVNPEDTAVIAPLSEETLTLFTCSGFLDSKRLIVTAKPSYL